ncbi:hypothetical protein OIO90_000265 [Microbotryomycetes sp. JL221]|nr:hypothetical protein OIO90_000265 [Microbotryomycetes sp. JL221]
MSAISSPSSLLTVHASSTPIQILSIARIAAGLGAFIAPAFFTQRAFKFSANKSGGGVQVGGSVGHNTTQPGNESEMSLAVRLFATRDFILGLLLRDSSAAVVTRVLQAGLISSLLDVAAAGLGYVEGTLSPETGGAVALVGGIGSIYSYWILNRSA